MKITNTN